MLHKTTWYESVYCSLTLIASVSLKHLPWVHSCRRRLVSWVLITWRKDLKEMISARPTWHRFVWPIATRHCAMSLTSSRRVWSLTRHTYAHKQTHSHTHSHTDEHKHIFKGWDIVFFKKTGMQCKHKCLLNGFEYNLCKNLDWKQKSLQWWCPTLNGKAFLTCVLSIDSNKCVLTQCHLVICIQLSTNHILIYLFAT